MNATGVGQVFFELFDRLQYSFLGWIRSNIIWRVVPKLLRQIHVGQLIPAAGTILVTDTIRSHLPDDFVAAGDEGAGAVAITTQLDAEGASS